MKIPVPYSGGLFLSYKCNAACRHCMYGCSPKWKADWISEENLVRIISQLAGKIQPSPYGQNNISLNHGLHITGGEPFLNFDLLCKAVEISSGFGIPSLFLETNCFWCTDDETTREKLELLQDKGLKGIMISVNPFYLEYVPFEKTGRAVRISTEVFGRNIMVYQVDYYRFFKLKGIKDKLSFSKYLQLENSAYFARNIEFFFMGRAPYSLKGDLENIYPKYAADTLLNVPCSPPFLRSWHNHFDNYGNYIPGYCGGITLGDCRELDELLKEGIDLDEYPVLRYLAKEDMLGLLKFAGDLGYVEIKDGYYSKCHLCVDIRKYLTTKGYFKELKPVEFYSHLSSS
jgi:hypothetical protein